MKILTAIVIGAMCMSAARPAEAQLPPDVKSDLGPDVPAFKVRPGYRVTRAVDKGRLDVARFLQFSEDGQTLYISGGGKHGMGEILALTQPDADGVYQKIVPFVTNCPSVQGMDVHDGWLYFSQAGEGSVSRARNRRGGDGLADQIEEVIPKGTLPSGGGHPYEGLLVTDKNIYVTSSDPQNMSPEESSRKTIYVFDNDGKNMKPFCNGVRNNEKLRLRPGTTEIWGFDNGNDNFGKSYGEQMGKNQPITDLNPPEEFNHYVEGGFYGQPFIAGNGVPRPEYATRPDIVDLAAKTIQPGWLLHAHWAVLGFTFVSSDYFPGLKGDVFCASHGSWNSVKPTGAVIQRVMFDAVTGLPCGSQTIVDCQNGERLSRPVDCAEGPDGTIIFSSDSPPGIFRISKSAQ